MAAYEELRRLKVHWQTTRGNNLAVENAFKNFVKAGEHKLVSEAAAAVLTSQPSNCWFSALEVALLVRHERAPELCETLATNYPTDSRAHVRVEALFGLLGIREPHVDLHLASQPANMPLFQAQQKLDSARNNSAEYKQFIQAGGVPDLTPEETTREQHGAQLLKAYIQTHGLGLFQPGHFVVIEFHRETPVDQPLVHCFYISSGPHSGAHESIDHVKICELASSNKGELLQLLATPCQHWTYPMSALHRESGY